MQLLGVGGRLLTSALAYRPPQDIHEEAQVGEEDPETQASLALWCPSCGLIERLTQKQIDAHEHDGVWVADWSPDML